MKINIKTTDLDLTPAISVYVEEKLGGLSRFVREFDLTGQAELWVELARTTRHHHSGLVFLAEADLRLPGKMLHAEHEDVDVRAAVDVLRTKLRLEIDKYKTRHSPRSRRGEK